MGTRGSSACTDGNASTALCPPYRQTKSPARSSGRAHFVSFNFANALICAVLSSGSVSTKVLLSRYLRTGPVRRGERPAPSRNRVGELAKTDLEQVIARYSETIMVHPADDNAYFRRGIANLYAGSVSKARADIVRASELDPHYPYYELWLHLVDQRLNQPGRLGETLARFEMTKWPAPIMRLYLGQATVPEVLAAAVDHDSETQRGQLCEANFYIAQLALQHGAKGEATRLFRLAATECPRGFVEGPAAGAELTAVSRDQ